MTMNCVRYNDDTEVCLRNCTSYESCEERFGVDGGTVRKSAVTAALLAMAIPGAGFIYAGSDDTGMIVLKMFFITLVAGLVLTVVYPILGLLFMVIPLTLYVWNVFGSVEKVCCIDERDV